LRSQETVFTWLGLREFGPKEQKRLKMMREYVTQVNKRAQVEKGPEVDDDLANLNLKTQNLSNKISSRVGLNLGCNLQGQISKIKDNSQQDKKEEEVPTGFKIIEVQAVIDQVDEVFHKLQRRKRDQ
jgi:hypothetical protein